MNEKLEKALKQIIFIGSALILLLPLFVYRGVMYPYIFSKMIVFRVIVELIFIVWLILMIYKKEYRPNWKNPLLLSLTIFVGVLLLTSILGVDFRRSFWSTAERMTGILTILHFWVWFLILTSTFANKSRSLTTAQQWKYWRILIYVSLLSSLLIGLYGIGQKLGISFLINVGEGRMASLLGNAIFLGVYNLLHIFLAIFLFFKEQKILLKILNILLAAFNFVIMSFTDSRSVMLVFIISLLLFLASLVINLSSKKRRRTMGLVIIFISLFIIWCYVFFQTPAGLKLLYQLPSIVGRIFYLKALFSSVEQRLIPWQIGLKGFLERPIFGWGWENFNIVFNKYFYPELTRSGMPGTWYDRSHNQMIDLLALSGVLGLLAYLIIYGCIFWLLLKKLRREKDENNQVTRITLSIVALMFLAYFAQNLTVFDTPAPLIMFYFGLGLAYFISGTDSDVDSGEKNKEKVNLKSQHLGRKQFPLPVLIILIIVFFPWAIYKFNIEPWQQSSLAIKAVNLSKRDLGIGLKFYKQALAKENVFINPEIRGFLAQTTLQQKKEDKNYKTTLIFAISEMEKNTKEQPLDVRHWLTLGQLYNLWFQEENEKEYLEKAEIVLGRAKELSPGRQAVYFELVKTKILKKDFDKAIQIAQQALELDPHVGDSYKVLAIAYSAANRVEEGIMALDKAREFSNIYSDVEVALYFSSSYFKFGETAKALEVAETAASRFPEEVLVFTHLAALYKEIGEKEKAIETVRKAVELQPSLSRGAESFIESLK